MYNYCISTSTIGAPLYVNGSSTLVVTDDLGAQYYASTTCPAVIETVQYVTDNPNLDMFLGVALFLGVMSFVTFYFLSRMKI